MRVASTPQGGSWSCRIPGAYYLRKSKASRPHAYTMIKYARYCFKTIHFRYVYILQLQHQTQILFVGNRKQEHNTKLLQRRVRDMRRPHPRHAMRPMGLHQPQTSTSTYIQTSMFIASSSNTKHKSYSWEIESRNTTQNCYKEECATCDDPIRGMRCAAVDTRGRPPVDAKVMPN